jgi:hypothetical protein
VETFRVELRRVDLCCAPWFSTALFGAASLCMERLCLEAF